jgi:hypothetical protein
VTLTATLTAPSDPPAPPVSPTTPHAAVLRRQQAAADLAQLAGRPCHLCRELTPWDLDGIGPTCDTCAPLTLPVYLSVRAGRG